MLIFVVGGLLGLIAGGALCVRYLRQEVAGDITKKLGKIEFQLATVQSQLENVQAEQNLANMTRRAEWSALAAAGPPRQLPS
jgi:hypothetical protein